MTPNSFPGSSRRRRVPRAAARFNIDEATFPRTLRPRRCLEKPHLIKTKWFAGFYHTHMHTHMYMDTHIYTIRCMHTCTHMHTRACAQTHAHTEVDVDPSSARLLGRQRPKVASSFSSRTPRTRGAQGGHVFIDLQVTPALKGVQLSQQTSPDYLHSRHTACFKIMTQKHPP